MKKFLYRAKRFSKKILGGEHPVKIKYSKEDWDAQFQKGNWDFLLETPQNNVSVVSGMIFDIATVSDKKIKILDVGCGNGSLARSLIGKNFDYVGIDISQKALDVAKKIYPDGTFIQSSMDEPSPVQEKFDVVIFCEVLLYGDYEKILNNFADNLNEDGVVIVSLYNVWRTKIIWKYVKKQCYVKNQVFVKNITKNVGWTVCLGKLSSK